MYGIEVKTIGSGEDFSWTFSNSITIFLVLGIRHNPKERKDSPYSIEMNFYSVVRKNYLKD